MLLAELVRTAEAVAATSARNGKVVLLADLLARLEPEEVAPAVGFLAGDPRQGRIGVGWSTLAGIGASPARRPSVTVSDLERVMALVLATTGPGSAEARAGLLAGLLGRATASEQDFVRRLLVGELRQGALEGVVTDAVARAATVPGVLVRRAMMLCGDLGRTAEIALREGEAGLAGVGLEVMRPVQPMLAATADDLAGALASAGIASVEWKLDGIRIQVHRAGGEVRVFTRNLNEVTARVPEIVAVARSLPVGAAVLDGEAIALDEADRPHLFQDTMSRVGRRTGEPAIPVRAYFFDCLHLDGTDLFDRPLTERLRMLEGVAAAWRIPSIVTAELPAAERFLADALAGGHEGVMVKEASSPYQAGRRGKAWLKVKPARALDLVVLAAEWGHGRRRGRLSNLHLGAREPSGGFVMVGKTFKGLTDAVLGWQTERLLALETRRSGITVHVRPELVVEVELDGVQTSPRYAGGVTLRFARVKRYRPDKRAAEADTIEDVRALLPRAAGR